MKASAKVATAGGGAAMVVAVALPLVAAFEGLRTEPYLDLVKKPTVCFGETNAEMRVYTRAECEAMLQRSLAKYANETLACLPPSAPIEVKASFTSLSYNNGVPLVCKSNTAEAARQGDYARACDMLLQWNLVRVNDEGWRKCPAEKRRFNKKTGIRRCVSDGLTNRRKAERELCRKGLS